MTARSAIEASPPSTITPDTPSGATPLIALSAVVIDTETTGLDPATARVVQIGMIRIEANALGSEMFETLVNPGTPIPGSATAIHGISDADVAGAPTTGDAIGATLVRVGGAVVIGHTIGFDTTILAREAARSGQPWSVGPVLDVRLLARAADPALMHDDLDTLCARFGIAIDGRHTAPGDARATARLFLALLPALRTRGIRTLAEADAACRRLAERQARAGGGLMAPPPAPDRRDVLVRIDSFPYRHLVRDVMSHPPVTAEGTTTIAEALGVLTAHGASSVFVPLTNGPPTRGTGWSIVTERDLLRTLHANRERAFAMALSALATRPLECVSDTDHVYRAIGRMTRLAVRHLGVVDAGGVLVGALTPRNLLRQRATTAIVLGDHVDSAGSAEALAAAWAQVPTMVRGLLEEAVPPTAIAAVISAELRAMTRRATELAVARMEGAGRGPSPVPFCVMVLGSAGRGESLMAADQDNAIVFAEGEPGGAADQWFAEMAGHMNAILDIAGIPFCKGGVMAREAAWRLSETGWQTRVQHWIRRHRPEDLLNVDIFFDAVPVHGDPALAASVLSFARHAARSAPDFLKLMAVQAADARAPLTLFGRVRTDETGRVDAKRHGLMAFFTAARVLALRHGVTEHGSADRLRAVAALGIGAASDIEAVLAAHQTLMEACLRQQLADIDAGVPPSPRVSPAALPPALRQALPGAFRAVATALDLVNEGRVG